MLWIPLAFFVSVVRASVRLSNQYFKLPGLLLVISSKAMIVLYMLPFAFLVPWPTAPWFYLILLLQAPFIVYRDKRIFDMTAQYGGGIVTRTESLSVLVLFFGWLLIKPSLIYSHMEDPLRFAGIIAAIGASVFFATRMRKCEVTLPVLKQMIPLIFCTAAISSLGKLSIDYGAEDSSVLIYAFVQSLIVIATGLSFNVKEKVIEKNHFLTRKTVLQAIALSFLILGNILGRMYAYRYVENPAYVGAIVLLMPFWILLFYRVVKHKEEGDISSGIGIVCSAIALTLLVAI